MGAPGRAVLAEKLLEAKQFGLFHWTLEPSSRLYPSSTSSRCWMVPKRGKLCSFALCRVCPRGENTQMASWPQELHVETAEFQVGPATVPGGGLTTEWAVCAPFFRGAMAGSPSGGSQTKGPGGLLRLTVRGALLPAAVYPFSALAQWADGAGPPGAAVLCGPW